MEKFKETKFHQSSVNKILYFKFQNGAKYIFTCSDDKTVKKYSIDNDKLEKTTNFENKVLFIKKIEESYLEEFNIYFIVSLSNGVLCLLNTEIDIIFKIPSRFKTRSIRQVLSLDNNDKNGKKGNFLLISEEKKIDVFVWIKEGNFEINLPKKYNNFHENKNYKSQQNFRDHYKRGRGRGGRGRGRGGRGRGYY